MNKYYEQDKKVLTAILQDHNLTKSELARQLNTSYSHINMILKGERSLGKKTLNAIKINYPNYMDFSITVPDELDAKGFIAIRNKLRLSQTDLATALETSQSLIAKIELGERVVSKAIIRALKELASSGEDKPLSHILYAPDELLNSLYLNNNKFSTEIVSIDTRLLPSSVHSKCKVITLDDNSCYPEFNRGDKIILDPTDNVLTNNKLQVIRVNNITYIGYIHILPDKIKCVPINEKYDSFIIDKNTLVIGSIIPRIRF